jgi:hypothetical protein
VRNHMLGKFLRRWACCFCELLRFPEIHCTFMLSHRSASKQGRFVPDVAGREWMLP